MIDPLQQIIDFIACEKQVDTKHIASDTHLAELGLDSIDASHLAAFIETHFGVFLEITYFLDNPTIGEIAEAIHRQQPEVILDDLTYNDQNTQEVVALSPYQKRLWHFFDENWQSIGSLNIGACIDIESQLSDEALVQVIKHIVNKYEVFYVYFEKGNTVNQRKSTRPVYHIECLNFSSLSSQTCHSKLQLLKNNMSLSPIELGEASLCRIKVVRLSPAHCVVLFVMPHILFDGWAFNLLAEEIAQGVGLKKDDKKIIPYFNFTQEMNQHYDQLYLIKRAEKYISHLNGMQSVFPYDGSVNQNGMPAGKTMHWTLPDQLVDGLKEYAKTQGITLHTIFLSIFLLSCHWLTANYDINVLFPVSNRYKRKDQMFFGLLANMLVLRQCFQMNHTLQGTIQETYQLFKDALSHSTLPLDVLLSCITQSHSTKSFQFQLFFDYQQPTAIYDDNSSVRLSELETNYVKFPINLVCVEQEGITVNFSFAKSFLSSSKAKLLFKLYKKSLEALVKQPDITHDQLRDYIYPEAPTIRVFGNYTVEPVFESLQYWMNLFEYRYHIVFAPYNQVIETIIRDDSALYTHKNGINALFLSLDSSSKMNTMTLTPLKERVAPEKITNNPIYKLPNGMRVFHHLRGETDFLYKEIMLENSYLKHNITLQKNATVIDIGANIGLFSLYINQICESPRIIACEPIPAICQVLSDNVSLYGLDNVSVLQNAIFDTTGVRDITYYPMSSLQSGCYADSVSDRHVVEQFAHNQVSAFRAKGQQSDYDEELVGSRFEAVTLQCECLTVSDLIKRYNLDSIDLLKVDVEKSELNVLKGITKHDWLKIKQVVLEVHDVDGRLDYIVGLLERHDFSVITEQEELFSKTDIYTVYAKSNSFALPCEYEQGFLKDQYKMEAHLETLYESLAANVDKILVPTVVGIHHHQDKKQSYQGVDKIRALCQEYEHLYFEEFSHTALSYSVKTVFDKFRAEMADVPFSDEYYTFVGTVLARRIHCMLSKPVKVIVVDCDNTLWEGLCAEDGARGVKIQKGNQLLQAFLRQQHQAGVLLCMCSKNNEQDVLEVFKHNNQMLLSLEQFVTHRINWESKSKNIQDIAHMLDLGLESFIFIDDSHVECMEVATHIPAVEVIPFDQKNEDIERFLQHIWRLDVLKVTQADTIRHDTYKHNEQRNRLKTSAPSMEAFIKLLDVKVSIDPAKKSDLSRINQLLKRVNQFNLTNQQYTEVELREMLAAHNYCIDIVEMQDKFGAYGVIGLIITEKGKKTTHIRAFLLSCRAFGRGVEIAMMRHIGACALLSDHHEVLLNAVPSSKNAPAMMFLENMATISQARVVKKYQYFCSPVALKALSISDFDVAEAKLKVHHSPEQTTDKLTRGFQPNDVATLTRASFDIESVHQQLARHRPVQSFSPHVSYVAPESEIEKALVDIWQRVLNVEQVGLLDNFFALGGHSLLSTSIAREVHEKYMIKIPLEDIYGLDTVQKLALYVEKKKHLSAQHDDIDKSYVYKVKRIDRADYSLEEV